jgi:hypothetical protein
LFKLEQRAAGEAEPDQQRQERVRRTVQEGQHRHRRPGEKNLRISVFWKKVFGPKVFGQISNNFGPKSTTDLHLGMY